MRRMFYVLLFLVPATFVSAAAADDAVYQGTWRTTNRKLDGTMTCVVTDLGKDQYQGRFYGVWQGVAFDYKVPFSGPRSELRGTAVIDGANYTWAGRIDQGAPDSFLGNFDGDRYRGSFELKEVPQTAAKP